MSITESLKAQMAQLTAQRREHEKAVNVIKRNEDQVPQSHCPACEPPGSYASVVNLFQFVLKLLERSGREFTLLSFGDRHVVEIGKYGYAISRLAKSMGGWMCRESYRPRFSSR